jgi:putative Ca2+/H+ antiporter (TMEM165/GDT1 family)
MARLVQARQAATLGSTARRGANAPPPARLPACRAPARPCAALAAAAARPRVAVRPEDAAPARRAAPDLPAPVWPAPRALGTSAVAVALALAAAGPAAAAVPAGILDSLGGVATYVPGLVGDSPLREGFVSASLLILFSEIGDKTFFIALLLALQQPKELVFAGTFGALAVMTLISVGLGLALHELDAFLPALPGGVPLDDALAVALLLFFGVSTLRGAAAADARGAEEREEAAEAVGGMAGGEAAAAAALATVASTFALVFAAEWGDKSFLATIALAAASDPAGVVLGAVAGHGAATAVAVAGGAALGKYLSERVVSYVGGSLFLVFAAATLYDIATGAHG